MTCNSPLERDTLLAYRLGELDADSEARVEEHYLGCASCSRRLEEFTALAGAVRAVTRMSGVSFVVNDRFVRQLAQNGLRVREYSVPLNGSVDCTVAPGDDFVIARLEAPLDEVERVDMVYLGSDGKPETRQEDVPFVAESGGVLFSTRIDMVRALPRTTLRVRLLAVDESGERILGEYRFDHTPYGSDRPR